MCRMFFGVMFLPGEENAQWLCKIHHVLQFCSRNGWGRTRGGRSHCQWGGGGVHKMRAKVFKSIFNCFFLLLCTRWRSYPSRTQPWPARRRATSNTSLWPKKNNFHVPFCFRLQLVISSLRGDGIDPEELLSRCHSIGKLFVCVQDGPFHEYDSSYIFFLQIDAIFPYL